MFNAEKEFHRLVIESLGKDGRSISALAKDLEKMGFKSHRLILTGYLRALTDMNMLKEKDVPPSKIYIPVRSLPDTIYESVSKACRKTSSDPDELILYCLNRLFKRPVFESELRSAGVTRPVGRPASEEEVNECRKILRRAGNVVSGNTAVNSSEDLHDMFLSVLAEMAFESTGSRHLIKETKQTRLI